MPAIQQKLFHAEPSDPLRCQATGRNGSGQCHYLSVAGMQRDDKLGDLNPNEHDLSDARNCPKHNGFAMQRSLDRQRVHDYKLQLWQERIGEFAESEQTKSLRGEIGILRFTLETILEQCQNQQDLILYSNKIADMVTRIERLVLSCDKLENRMGLMLDKAAALMLASRIVEVISAQVENPDVIDHISNGIIDAIVSVTGLPEPA